MKQMNEWKVCLTIIGLLVEILDILPCSGFHSCLEVFYNPARNVDHPVCDNICNEKFQLPTRIHLSGTSINWLNRSIIDQRYPISLRVEII